MAFELSENFPENLLTEPLRQWLQQWTASLRDALPQQNDRNSRRFSYQLVRFPREIITKYQAFPDHIHEEHDLMERLLLSVIQAYQETLSKALPDTKRELLTLHTGINDSHSGMVLAQLRTHGIDAALAALLSQPTEVDGNPTVGWPNGLENVFFYDIETHTFGSYEPLNPLARMRYLTEGIRKQTKDAFPTMFLRRGKQNRWGGTATQVSPEEFEKLKSTVGEHKTGGGGWWRKDDSETKVVTPVMNQKGEVISITVKIFDAKGQLIGSAEYVPPARWS